MLEYERHEWWMIFRHFGGFIRGVACILRFTEMLHLRLIKPRLAQGEWVALHYGYLVACNIDPKRGDMDPAMGLGFSKIMVVSLRNMRHFSRHDTEKKQKNIVT